MLLRLALRQRQQQHQLWWRQRRLQRWQKGSRVSAEETTAVEQSMQANRCYWYRCYWHPARRLCYWYRCYWHPLQARRRHDYCY